ncbi:CAP domain-containing protein [Sorangium sp. So ce1000]|uniref:CAP domain-containing protein n=1 Tax=Sorangium sp. So ce1000 TaxID=3133325 RepID=UPI003F5E1966
MRIASFSVLAFAFACSSSPDEPGGSEGAGGAAAGAPGTSGTGGVTQPNGGATSAGGNATNGGATTGGAAMGGASTGGESAGGSSESAGTASDGASAGAGGANGGAGGGGACVKNLACKLDPPPSTGDLAQDCVDRINQFLTQCACLPALKRREDGEACANEMAKYDADHNMAHAGIGAKICEPGGSQNSCPGYSSNKQVIGLCMQQMWDEGPPPTANCTGDCYEMYGHFINMTDDSVTQVACGFYTTSSGKVWAVQNFTR